MVIAADSILCRENELKLYFHGSKTSTGNCAISHGTGSMERNIADLHQSSGNLSFCTDFQQGRVNPLSADEIRDIRVERQRISTSSM